MRAHETDKGKYVGQNRKRGCEQKGQCNILCLSPLDVNQDSEGQAVNTHPRLARSVYCSALVGQEGLKFSSAPHFQQSKQGEKLLCNNCLKWKLYTHIYMRVCVCFTILQG